MIPPSLLALRLNRVGIWLPLFLLWPLLVLALPFVALAALFMRRPLRAVAEGWHMVCALRGLEIFVEQPDQVIRIKFI